MPNIALVPEYSTRIPILEGVVDGYPDETHKLVTDTGNSPLEDGAIITDHAVARAEQLNLTGMVSDLTSEGADRPEAAWTLLRRLHEEVIPLDVITWIAYYEEMLITEVVGHRVGKGLRFRMKLERVLRVGLVPQQIQEESSSYTAIGRDTELPRGRVDPSLITAPVDAPEAPTLPELLAAPVDAKAAAQVPTQAAVSKSMIASEADFSDFASLPKVPSLQSLIPGHASATDRVETLASRIKGPADEVADRMRGIKKVVDWRRYLRQSSPLPGVSTAFDIVDRFSRPRLPF